jgi:DNA (cytosine-5)-methyltransferase 1
VTRPRLLDLFCGAGGAAMGYHRAGFDVVGVDIAPQPHYPFEFHQGDAMTWPLDGFDAIHASPPCQAYSSMGNRGRRPAPDLLALTIARLRAHGAPFVVENVEGPAAAALVWLLAVEVARLRRPAVSTGRLGRPSPATGGHRTVTLTRRGARPYDWKTER